MIECFVSLRHAFELVGRVLAGVGPLLFFVWAVIPGARGVEPDAVATFGNQSIEIRAWGCTNGTQAYSVRGGVCNIGTDPLEGDPTGDHPMWSSNAYRLHNDRFEQIGMSWIKHDDWSSDASNKPCSSCGTGLHDCNPITGDALDVGCSDVYDACRNGRQHYQTYEGLGPRSQINPWSGAWPVNISPDPGRYCGDISGSTGVTACRLQVLKTDFSDYSGAQYFLEQQVIHPDEPVANRYNNVSYKPASVGSCLTSNCDADPPPCGEALSCSNCNGCVYELKVGIGSCSNDGNCDDTEPCTTDLCVAGVCQHICTSYLGEECEIESECNDSDSCTNDACVEIDDDPLTISCEYTCTDACLKCCKEPAIKAWKKADSSVVETVFQEISGGSALDGKFFLAAKASHVSGCTYEYEYALYNMNSYRGAKAFKVPTSILSSDLTNRGFHGIAYHSGEPYDAYPWVDSVSGGYVAWSIDSGNSSNNALNWGTLYNYRFRAPGAHVTATVHVYLNVAESGRADYLTGTSIGPPPARACCYDGDSCMVTTECHCDELPGVWSEFTSCNPGPCAMRSGE